jgi:DNA polymerase-4
MDAFYASVEQARRPELAGLPVVVGGSEQERGVVSTASYEARALGVHTAMPTAQAKRLCPQAIYLPVDMPAYLDMQKKLLAIFGRFTEQVEPVSIDEAYLDVTGSRRLFGSPQAIAATIQCQVCEELALSCSIGIGPTQLLAKLAANLHKPGGITTLSEQDVHGRLRSLPVAELPGIGPITARHLRAIGITTVGALQDASPDLLAAALPGGTSGLQELASGGSREAVRAGHAPPKQLGHEVTFAVDVADEGALRACLLDLCDRSAGALRGKGLCCRTVALKLRDQHFHTFGGQRTLATATSATGVVFETASALLCELHADGRPLRLVGVSLSGLCAEAPQLALDDSWRQRASDAAVDAVRAKYGKAALRRAGADLAPYRKRSGPAEPSAPTADE